MRRALMMVAAAVISAAACSPGAEPGAEYMPDMARAGAYKAYEPNPALPHGATLQRPVAGSIARGHAPVAYGAGVTEAERAGRELINPYAPATTATLHKGKALYQIYCLVCHGEEGKGDGPMAAKIPPPPSYVSPRLMAYSEGRLFHVMSRGAGKMPAYATQLSPDERWLVATYVHVELQRGGGR